MNILFLGDVVARSGRQAVIERLRSLKNEYAVDFTIINGENAAHGKGITQKIYNQFMKAGADVITLGNHAFAKREIETVIDQCPNLIRPINGDHQNIGNGFITHSVRGKHVAVINVLGSVFMNDCMEDPITALEKALRQIRADIIIVDFHAEATAEKNIILHHFKSKVTAIIGTHTHVQTADEHIQDGCAYISDVGMCGPYESILGRDVDEVLHHFVDGMATYYTPASGAAVISGCLIEVDDQTNRAVRIERIQVRPD